MNQFPASSKANQKLADVTRSVAIVGMACRFPGQANTPADFWQMLCNGEDAISDIPSSRMDVDQLYSEEPATPGRIMTRYGGYLDDIEHFDAGFFHISPREAERMDPQQRLILETAWEAIEDAGIDASSLSGRSVGVYVGQWLSDFEMRILSDPTVTDFEMTTGSGRYTTAGRLSHFLGLMGPSLTLDTACSSSLTAVHLAIQSLRSGEIELAFAAGVNVILSPHITVGYSQSQMMAPDGRCKFGDAAGNGYVRSEGAGTVLLKRLDRALKDGDKIHAVIRGSAINNDGNSSGSFGTPSRYGQEALLRQALVDADLSPSSVGYVEAHGTGTRKGDPVELQALSTVLGTSRSEPIRVGSVKTNIGHTEGAAGMAGLIKATMAVKTGQIPASLHLQTPNPDIDWNAGPITIVRKLEPWPADDRYAGVSGFGIAGSNAHLLLQNAPSQLNQSGKEVEFHRPSILPLSAQSEGALRESAARYAKLLEEHPDVPLREICAAAALNRTALSDRAALISHSRGEMITALRQFSTGADNAIRGNTWSGQPINTVFVAPGQGGQWAGMARSLIASEPSFQQAIAECEHALAPLVDWSLSEQIQLSEGDVGYRLNDIAVIQPTLVALAISYARLWRAFGVSPKLSVGHSMGEVSAAAVSGILSVADAMRVVVARSKLMARTSGEGGMALVELSAPNLKAWLEPFVGKLSLAAINSPRASVISGKVPSLDTLLEALSNEGIFCRKIKVDVASHGPQMAQLAPDLAAALHDIVPSEPDFPMLSTVTGDMVPGQQFNGDYWAQNLKEPVRFLEAIEAALKAKANAFIELGPNPVLLTSIEQTLSHHHAEGILAASERRDSPAIDVIAEGIAKLWVSGVEMDWSAYTGEVRVHIPLPQYPWQRTRHWHEAAERSDIHQTRQWSCPPDQMLDLLHQIEWVKSSPPVALTKKNQTWLVLSTKSRAANSLVTALEEAGTTVHFTDDETVSAPLSKQIIYDGIVAIASGEDAGFLPIKLLHLLLENSIKSANLVFITQGASTASGANQRVSVEQAPLIGTMRVVAEEHPEYTFRLVDADPNIPLEDQNNALAAHVLLKATDPEVAFRGQDYLIPRLQPMVQIDKPHQGVQIKRDSAYMITGGLSALGLRAATVLAKAGARHIILVSRRPLAPRAQWRHLVKGSEDADRIAGVLALEAAGVAVETLALDVTDEDSVHSYLAERATELRPPIRGLIHLATVYDTQLAAETDKGRFDAAIAAKLNGARILDRALPDVDLFVLYSSTMTFVPHQGLAAYSAANCGLDALAADRRAQGKLALSISWGPWKQLGRAALDYVAKEFEQRGELSISAEEGDLLLGWLLGGSVSDVSVFRMDWSTFKKSRQGRPQYLIDELLKGATDVEFEETHFDNLPPEERRARANIFVPNSVAKVLKLDQKALELHRPIGDLGLNSLMGIELRNALEKCVGRPLPATLAWTYPTTQAVIDFLCADIEIPAPHPIRFAQTYSGPPTDLDESFVTIGDMTEDEALAALLGDRK